MNTSILKIPLKYFPFVFIDECIENSPTSACPIDDEAIGKVVSKDIPSIYRKVQQRYNSTPSGNLKYDGRFANRKFFPYADKYKLLKAVLLRKFSSTDDCSMSQIIVPICPENIPTVMRPASSTVSLDVTKAKEVTFNNYHVICETKRKDNKKGQ